ncbi:MAG: FMN-binding negative transcriptional regulator, partial [Candidatus Krumholzibacteriota bacterium]|nr:FMN-binding negative transcriptional regulator [Candidatus Krumholzibacteriota bacterium]
MYTPSSYREDDPAVLHDLIQRYNFATLFTPESAQVTHLPFLLETDRGPHGTLVSHMARANPH